MGTVGRLVQDHDQPGRLHDSGEAAEIEERDAHRHAVRKRTVLPEVLHPLLTYRLGPRSHRVGRQVLSDVVIITILSGRAGSPGLPNAGQGWLAVRCAGRWCGKVRFAVR